MSGVDEWSREGMEDRRPPCFHFFLGEDECEHGPSCNYNHNAVFKANLGNIPQNASKESLLEDLKAFSPVHVAFTGNPPHRNFGRGCGIVGFQSTSDLVTAAIATQSRRGEGVKVSIIDHKCLGCGVPMRFSASGNPYYKSSSITGSKKEPKSIARQAAGPFECGECREGSKKQASSDRPRALKTGEMEW